MAKEQGDGSVLTLYSTKVLRLTYYNNNQTKLYWRRYYYEGTATNLNSSPNPENESYKGWSRYKGGTGVWGKFSSRITMTGNLNLYLVVYPRIRYFDRTGRQVLYSEFYRRGTSVTLKQVPSLSGYRSLGWAKTKNASEASYQQGASVELSANLDLYAAYRYLPYKVIFTNNDGTSSDSAFSKLCRRAAAGEYIKLPELPAVSGFSALGWSESMNASSASLKSGTSVKVTKDITYYAVYRKARSFKVLFLDTNGSSGSSFSALNRNVTEDSVITLPAIPARSGYSPVCWKIKMNNEIKTYNAGTKIKVSGNYRFYASYVSNIKVILHYNDGKTFQTVNVPKGSKYGLPCMDNPNGYTFMGWCSSKGVTLCPYRPMNNYYQAGNQITVSGTVHLYAVLMKRSEEGSVVNGQLYGSGSPDLSAYRKIVFVGDSRTDRLKKTLDRQIGEKNYKNKNVSFIYKSGEGLSWLKETGFQKLKNEIKQGDTYDVRPAAVIFNLGINDLASYNDYISYIKQIAPELKNANCRLFYMSVNPINSTMIKKMGFAPRWEWEVRRFNTNIRSGLSGTCTYIDVYSWLMQTGYSTNLGEGGYDVGSDDGLHYSVNTYKRIYLRCLQFLAGYL